MSRAASIIRSITGTTVAARIARVIITASVLGWLVCTFLLPENLWTIALRHACEGAFIGGICDWFAIYKVYSKIEGNFERVTSEVSVAVIEDLVQPESVVAELSERLHEPEFARSLMQRVEAIAPDQQAIRTFIEDVWKESLEERVIGWLVDLDPRESLVHSGDQPLLMSLLSEDGIRSVILHCLREAVGTPANSAALYNALIDQYGHITVFEIPAVPLVKPRPTPVSLERVLLRTVNEVELHSWLQRAVDKAVEIDLTADRGATPLGECGRAYLVRYATAWVELPIEERRQAAQNLVDRLAPLLLDTSAETIWQHRTRLQEIVQQDLPLNAIPVIEYVSDEVGGLVKEQLSLNEHSQELLQSRLAEMDPREFRKLLENRTRSELDWIQVNGSGLGFVLGLVVGLGNALLH